MGNGSPRLRACTCIYVRSHADQPTVRKLRQNEQLTAADLAQLAAIFTEPGFVTVEDIARASDEHGGFGWFLRSLTGLDYETAAEAFSQFRASRSLGPPQRGYLDPLIDVLAKNGMLTVGNLYEAPFTLRAPRGPDDLFADAKIDEIAAVHDAVRTTAQPVGAM